jgi:hypothetical protein
MNQSPVPKVVFIIVGLVAFLLGVITAVMQLMAMFSAAGIATYNTLYPNTLSGAAAQSSMVITNFWMALAGIMGGLLFMSPVKLGRSLRVVTYTTPDEEAVPKSYRGGGLYLIIGGILAVVARLFFSPVSNDSKIVVLVLPFLFIILGVAGLVASLVKPKQA